MKGYQSIFKLILEIVRSFIAEKKNALYEDMNKEINNSIFKNAIKGGYSKKERYVMPVKNSLVIYNKTRTECTLNNFEDAPSAYINFLA